MKVLHSPLSRRSPPVNVQDLLSRRDARRQCRRAVARGSTVGERTKWLDEVKIGLIVFGVLVAVASLAAMGVRLIGF